MMPLFVLFVYFEDEESSETQKNNFSTYSDDNQPSKNRIEYFKLNLKAKLKNFKNFYEAPLVKYIYSQVSLLISGLWITINT